MRASVREREREREREKEKASEIKTYKHTIVVMSTGMAHISEFTKLCDISRDAFIT